MKDLVKNSQNGYVRNPVTIQDIFKSKRTKETSEKALRARAKEEILVFLESVGNTFYFDEQPSIIRVVAARNCKRPLVSWSRLSNVLKRNNIFSADVIISRLKKGESENQIIRDISEKLAVLVTE